MAEERRKKARRLSLRQVADLIREAVESGRTRFTRHAMEEMAADRLTAVDISTVLRGCAVIKNTGHDVQKATWTYQAEGSTEDGARVAVLAAVPEDPEEQMIPIVTVWRLEKMRR